MKITAPDAIAPGDTVSFTATASMSDGTTQDVTAKVLWSSTSTAVLSFAGGGQATAKQAGDVTIFANLPGCCEGRTTRTILPPNTYRLTGKVLESGLPVAGAVVAVVSGVGTGLSATTGIADGGYAIYGVAGSTQIRFSKAGYDPIVKPFTATQNDVLDFTDVRQSAGIPSLAGAYTLTLTADPACPTVQKGGTVPLPDDFRSPRSYAASIAQDGPSLTVTLTGPDILATRNKFAGRIGPDSIEFQIGLYSYYYIVYPSIIERISATEQFEFGGQLHAKASGTSMAGTLDGLLAVATQTGVISAQCAAPNNQVTMTPAVQPLRHR
jgi:hypothetical protein